MTATVECFVKVRHPDGATFWSDRDTNDTGLETTITDIADGQIDYPFEVWCASDGLFIQISEDIAREIAHRKRDEHLSPALIDFIEKHCGLALARELKAA